MKIDIGISTANSICRNKILKKNGNRFKRFQKKNATISLRLVREYVRVTTANSWV